MPRQDIKNSVAISWVFAIWSKYQALVVHYYGCGVSHLWLRGVTRSTGNRFKKLFLSIVFTILKKSCFLNIQPVHLDFFQTLFFKNLNVFKKPCFSKISQKPCLRLLTFAWTHVLTCSSCISENMYKNQYSLRSFVLLLLAPCNLHFQARAARLLVRTAVRVLGL